MIIFFYFGGPTMMIATSYLGSPHHLTANFHEGLGGPSAEELIQLLDQCDISNSLCSTPCMSPCLSSMSSNTITRLKASNVAFLNQVHNNE